MRKMLRSPAWVQPRVPDEMADLFKNAKTIKLKKHTILANQGDDLYMVYYLESGMCWQTFSPVEHHTATVNLILPGRCMGDIFAVLKRDLYFNFETLQDSVLKAIPKNIYLEKLEKGGRFTLDMLHHVADKESSYVEGMLYNSILQVEERLTILLVNIAKDNPSRIEDGYIMLPYKLTQDILADIIHASRATVNKIIQDWFANNILKKNIFLYLSKDFFNKMSEA